MKNYSKQREAVLRVLKSTKTHPTAQWVYEQVRAELPHISLATVYRNLMQLRNEGVIRGITVGDGFEHFDGDASPHLHLHCRRCSRIIDAVLQEDCLRTEALKLGFSPDSSVYVIYGVCRECSTHNEKDSEIN